MSDRLAEIEARVERWEVKGTVEGDIDGEPWGVEGVVGIAVTMRESDYDWLVARIRELEAQAALDVKVREAARAYRAAERKVEAAGYASMSIGDRLIRGDLRERLDAALADAEVE